MANGERITSTVGQDESLREQEFLDRLQEPLQRWQTSTVKIEVLTQELSNPQGQLYTTTQVYVENIQERLGSHASRKRLGQAFQLTFRGSIKALTDPSPKEATPQQYNSGVARMGQLYITYVNFLNGLRKDFQEEVEPLKASRREASSQIIDSISNFLQADFNNLILLADSNPNEFNQLFIFIAEHGQELLEKQADLARQKELEKPSPSILISFLDQIGVDYYKDKKDSLWLSLMLFHKLTPSEIEFLYSPDIQDEYRRQILFSNFVQDVLSGTRILTPELKSKYFGYLLLIQKNALRKLAESISAAKPKEPKVRPVQAAELYEVSETSPTNGISAAVSTKESETVVVNKAIIINGNVISTEDGLDQELIDLFGKLGVREFRANDVGFYKLILAKLAKMRDNAPNYKIEKLRGFPDAIFNDGQHAPLFLIRLISKDPPRLIVALHSQYVAVVHALNRTDRGYQSLMKDRHWQVDIPVNQ